MFDQILSVLFPERCRLCRKNGSAICGDCIRHIPRASFILSDIPSSALFDYSNKTVQQAVWELKYHRKSPLAKRLAQYGASELVDLVSGVVQSTTPLPIVLIPIPQHYTKTFSRGFNQSKLIATWLQPALEGADMLPLLRKTKGTVAQAHAHTRYEREKNLRHSMKASEKLNKKTLYILVDDVITSGSTIREAGRALRAAGAKHICAIALAHGYAQRD